MLWIFYDHILFGVKFKGLRYVGFSGMNLLVIFRSDKKYL